LVDEEEWWKQNVGSGKDSEGAGVQKKNQGGGG